MSRNEARRASEKAATVHPHTDTVFSREMRPGFWLENRYEEHPTAVGETQTRRERRQKYARKNGPGVATIKRE